MVLCALVASPSFPNCGPCRQWPLRIRVIPRFPLSCYEWCCDAITLPILGCCHLNCELLQGCQGWGRSCGQPLAMLVNLTFAPSPSPLQNEKHVCVLDTDTPLSKYSTPKGPRSNMRLAWINPLLHFCFCECPNRFHHSCQCLDRATYACVGCRLHSYRRAQSQDAHLYYGWVFLVGLHILHCILWILRICIQKLSSLTNHFILSMIPLFQIITLSNGGCPSSTSLVDRRCSRPLLASLIVVWCSGEV